MRRNLFEPLEMAAEWSSARDVLQGTKAYGAHYRTITSYVPARERWPRHPHENFYWLQEDYLTRQAKGKDWHWTIPLPTRLFSASRSAVT